MSGRIRGNVGRFLIVVISLVNIGASVGLVIRLSALDLASLHSAAENWMALKELLREQTHLPQVALHIYAGVVLYLLIMPVVRSQKARWFALMTVVAIALLNEVSDFIAIRHENDPYSWCEAASDIGHTIFIPAVLAILGFGRKGRHEVVNLSSATRSDDPL